MDIKATSIYAAYQVPPARGSSNISSPKRSTVLESDKLSLSAEAEDYKTAMRVLAQTPDVRHEVVSRIQSMIAAGTYRVSSFDVASRIFQGLER